MGGGAIEDGSQCRIDRSAHKAKLVCAQPRPGKAAALVARIGIRIRYGIGILRQHRVLHKIQFEALTFVPRFCLLMEALDR